MNLNKNLKTQLSICSGFDQSHIYNDLKGFYGGRGRITAKKNRGKPGFFIIDFILSFYDRRITSADQIKSSKKNGIVEQVAKQAVVEKGNTCHISLHQT